jgi:hypothetical protein
LIPIRRRLLCFPGFSDFNCESWQGLSAEAFRVTYISRGVDVKIKELAGHERSFSWLTTNWKLDG